MHPISATLRKYGIISRTWHNHVNSCFKNVMWYVDNPSITSNFPPGLYDIYFLHILLEVCVCLTL